MVDNEDFDPEGGEAEQGGFDLERLGELWGFVKRAARRRIKLALTVLVVVASLGIGIAAVMPRQYQAEVKLSTNSTKITRSIVNQNGGGLDAAEASTKSVAQMIMRRENLVALVRDSHLVDRNFYDTRPKVLRLKDKVIAKLFGPMSREDMEKAMVGTLETKLVVTVTDDGIVDITVDWANAQIAYDIATLVQTNFLAARYDDDVSAINESIAILDDHAKSELTVVDAALENYQKVVNERIVAPALAAAASSSARTPGAPPRTYAGIVRAAAAAGTPVPAVVDPDIAKALEDKRAEIRSLEDSQQKQLDTLRQQLSTAQLTLTPMHPTVITLQQRIDAMSQPSPDLLRLRGDEHALMAQIVSARPVAPSAPGSPRPATGFAPLSANAADAGTDTTTLPPPMAIGAPTTDGQVQLAQSKLEGAIRGYQDAVARIDQARIQLDLAHATFIHRYQVFTPAEVPRKPKKATATIIGVASIFAAILLALIAAAAADLSTGVVIETWQVRRRLKLDVIGELDSPS